MSDLEKLRDEVQALRTQLAIVGSVLRKMNTLHHWQNAQKSTSDLEIEVNQELDFLEREQKKHSSS